MTGAPAVVCPLALVELLRRFIAEDATTTLRHDVRNRLTAIRNGAFFVKRRLEKEATLVEQEPRLLHFLSRIDEEAEAIAGLLSPQLPPVTEEACGLDEVTSPFEAVVTLQRAEAPLRVSGNAAELQVALYCLLEEARPPPTVRMRDGGLVRLEVEGVAASDRAGLRISKLIAERWGGTLELSSTLAALELRRA